MQKFTILFLLVLCVHLRAQDFTGTMIAGHAAYRVHVLPDPSDSIPLIWGINGTEIYTCNVTSTSPLTYVVYPTTANTDNFTITSGDVDSDGDLDLLVSNDPVGLLNISYNTAPNTYMDVTTNLTGATNFIVADSDLDGDKDIFGFNMIQNKVYLFVNNGMNTFIKKQIYASTRDMETYAVGDMNQDGKPDVVISYDEFSGNEMEILRNTAGNTFPSQGYQINVFGAMESIAIADFDTDGKNDIVGAVNFGVAVFKNLGNLQFEELNVITASVPRSVAVADYNGDGKVDVAIGTNSTGLSWYENASVSGSILFIDHYISGIAPGFSVDNADLDNDGDMDMVVVNGDLWYFVNNIPQVPSAIFDPKLQATEMSAYPNPAAGAYLSFESELPSTAKVDIFNAYGQHVATRTLIQNQVFIDDLVQGMYFVSIKSETTAEVKTAVFSKL